MKKNWRRMINQDLIMLDETIALVRSKDEDLNYFSKISLHKFEFHLFLCLDIIRFELQSAGKISDLTAEAISQLFVFQTFEFYYREYPEVYSQCSMLFNTLIKYNEKLEKHELGALGVKDNQWIEYFNERIANLILLNKPNN